MEINLAEGESFNIKGGDGLKVNGKPVDNPDLSEYAKTDEVPAAINKKDINPKSVLLEGSDRLASYSADDPLNISEEGSGVLKDCFFSFGLSDLTWYIDCEEEDYQRTISSYSGKRISLSCENYQNVWYREFQLNLPSGTVSYLGPEGEVEKSIYDWINGGGDGGVSNSDIEELVGIYNESPIDWYGLNYENITDYSDGAQYPENMTTQQLTKALSRVWEVLGGTLGD